MQDGQDSYRPAPCHWFHIFDCVSSLCKVGFLHPLGGSHHVFAACVRGRCHIPLGVVDRVVVVVYVCVSVRRSGPYFYAYLVA